MTSPNTNPVRQPLSRIFAPRHVAVIGASDRPGSVGHAIVNNLQMFPGTCSFVNPRQREVCGRPAYPSIAAVPGPVDMAVISVPAAGVPQVIHDCAAAGVGGAVVISAGFREVGAEGLELERRMVEAARATGLRIVGPNCLGVMVPPARLNATFANDMAQPGHVAFLSQSGALCTAVLDWSWQENVRFSAFVSVGAMADVGWGDLLSYFGTDPHTRSIVCYMESIGDARQFMAAAREVSRTKPIVVLKVGRTEAGARAAVSHTGALTGSDAVVDAAFRRAGVLRVNRIEELFDMAEMLSKQPLPRGPRLAIVTNAGGPAALAADTLVGIGGVVPPLALESLSTLNRELPPQWSHGNPIDVLGDAGPERYARAVEVAAADPNTDGVLVILTPQAMTDPLKIAQCVRPVAGLAGKPILASWMGGASVIAGETVLNEAGIPTLKYPDRAASAFGLMWRHSDNLRVLHEASTPTPATLPPVQRDRAASLLATVQAAGRTLLTEAESKAVLAAYGLPVVPTEAVFSEEDAVRCAEKTGFPVVLKVLSHLVTHKAAVGGVKLDLRDSDAVRAAWRDIRETAERASRGAFLGVTVQPMVPRAGHELIVGCHVDPQFGPVLLLGAGGRDVEVFRDTAIGLPPLNTPLARRLVAQTRLGAALLSREEANMDAIIAWVVRFSQLIVDQPRIAELDVNPLLVSPAGVLALDARVVLHAAGVTDEALPRPVLPGGGSAGGPA